MPGFLGSIQGFNSHFSDTDPLALPQTQMTIAGVVHGAQQCRGSWVLWSWTAQLRQKPNSAAYNPKEAQATDAVGFGSRRETMSQRGPERGLSWQNLDNQRSLGTDAFAASDRVTF